MTEPTPDRATSRPGHPPLRPTQPLDVDGVRTAVAGTVLWGVAFVVLLPFRGRLAADGRLWWLWTCLAGVALGFVAVGITLRRRRRRAAAGAD